MTVEELFNKLLVHMREGVQFHTEMALAYDYLNIEGLYACHIYRAYDEKQSFERLYHYYITHYFKLLQLENISQSKLIPETWYKYTTQAVDSGTKRNAIKELMEKWVKWEQETKKLYQEMRQELIQLGETASALYIDQYIIDVDNELQDAQNKLMRLETINYDLIEITNWQERLYKKYKKKLGW